MKHIKHLKTRAPYAVVDLFAGPGGLGEGFASCVDANKRRRFDNVISIERDPFAHQTLMLRHFFRSFNGSEVPDDYYDFLANRITLDELFARHPAAHFEAGKSALRLELGAGSHSVVQGLINDRLKRSDRWVLVGGPPCQAYSLVGRSRMMADPDFKEDVRHTLYLEYLKIIADHRPPVFVMENVKGLLSATIDGTSTISRIIRDLQRPVTAIASAPISLAYRLYSLSEDEPADPEVDPRLFIVRAEKHGIPQARHRMFIVGVRSDLNVRPRTLRKQAPPTVKETIGSLPAIRSSVSRQTDDRSAWHGAIQELASMEGVMFDGMISDPRITEKFDELRSGNVRFPRHTSSNRYVGTQPANAVLRGVYDERLSVLTSHEARSHMPSDLRRYFFAATFADVVGVSPKLSDFPDVLLPRHKNVEQGRSGKMFADRFRVQLANEVATTVTSHISKDGHYFIHYDPRQCRSLTVREAARLQTFPDNYFFAGPRTAQYHQVGNAVPPQLANQIAEIVAEVLDSIKGLAND